MKKTKSKKEKIKGLEFKMAKFLKYLWDYQGESIFLAILPPYPLL